MITYSEAAARVARSRSGEARLGNNTTVRSIGGNAYAVRYHYTDVLTVHDDGTYTLNTGGWNTVTTLRRLNDYGPARVSSIDGQLVIWTRDDPRTPPKIQKCRHCHGTAVLHTTAYTETRGYLDHDTFEVVTETVWNTERNGNTYASLWDTSDALKLTRDGRPVTGQPQMINVVGQVNRVPAGTWTKLPVPVFHPSESYPCPYDDAGPGMRDYGSKPRPVIFDDGITVDSSGHVTDPDAPRMFPTAEEIAATREAQRIAAEKAAVEAKRAARRVSREHVAARKAWPSHYGVTVEDDGTMIVFKAVDADLKSGYGMAYPIGQHVSAPDWNGLDRCGGGLHFTSSPRDSRSYFPGATRFLACRVPVRGLRVIGDKIKVRSADVLYEVDIDGNRI